MQIVAPLMNVKITGTCVATCGARAALSYLLLALLLVGCGGGGDGGGGASGEEVPASPEIYDPLQYALSRVGDPILNLEAPVTSMCYTATGGISNPCWTCHTGQFGKNYMEDWELQEEYAFSDAGLENHWTNLFADRSSVIAGITDEDALAWIREDNYTPLVESLRDVSSYPGFRPDLDFDAGFDADGFARDGSGWRAIRYKPFLGTFWPTNGSTDDVLVRLPEAFGRDALGEESREILKINYAILEAAICVDPSVADADVERRVEPVDEAVAGVDLDGSGVASGVVDRIRSLPAFYVGQAGGIRVTRHLYPEGIEFLHTVRYVDPDAPTLLSKRMKEVRYSRKVAFLDNLSVGRAYTVEIDEKELGKLPAYAGGIDVGLQNNFGWLLTGYIEDPEGRLRLQTEEEHRFCMGCHSTIGVTVDQTFGFPRKVPGVEGWRHQDLAGILDVPQATHAEPETLTYFKRVRGGDEFRANDEILARFFPGDVLDEAEVRRAAPGGDLDLRHLIEPSRERALALTKAYMALVREGSFRFGRDTVLSPAVNVHREIDGNGETELGESGLIFRDGRLWLDW